MHNCIIAGNVADDGAGGGADLGGGVFGGLYNEEDVEAVTELAHCTLIGNYAGQGYGGAVNYGYEGNSFMQFHNSITWGNADGNGSTDAIDAQLFYAADTLVADDVDNNIIDNLNDGRFTTMGGSEVNKADDPVFAEDGSSTMTWTSSTWDLATGRTIFATTNTGSAAPGMLFRVDQSGYEMLIVETVSTNSAITCVGYWPTTTAVTVTGKFYDLHIDSSGGADDYGDTNHVPADDCDLDNDGNTMEPLPYDIEPPNGRNQGSGPLPDAGAYEIVYP